MKKFILFLIVTCLTLNSFAQSPNWQWAKNAGTIYSDFGYTVGTDKTGNVYMAGTFSDTITFGAYTLAATYTATMFLVKYDSLGNVLWAKCASGPNNQRPTSIATDNAGNVYVVGNFVGASVTFSPVTLLNPSSWASTNTFIVKYDANGNVLWAKTNTSGGGSTAHISSSSVTIDNMGNAYITGTFSSSTVTFDAVTLTNVGPSFKYDIFTTKYDASGNVIWAKRAGGTDDDVASSIAVDASGNTFISGYFLSTTFTIGAVALTNTGTWDGFIAKYDPTGNAVWAKRMVGNNGDRAHSVATDDAGNVYLGGYFTSAVCSFDTITVTAPCCNYNGFLAKFNTSGNILWFKSILTEGTGGWNEERINSIAIDKIGNIFVGGTINSNIHFGASYITAQTSFPSLFIGKYDGGGNELWAKKVNGINHEDDVSIATDTLGNLYTAGWYFDPSITFTHTTLTNTGQKDVYLAKLDDVIIPPVHDTVVANGCGNYIFNGTTYYSTGMYYQSYVAASGSDSVLFLDLTIDYVYGFVYQSGSGLTSYDALATYQWLDCNNSSLPIPGATNQNFTGVVPGSYAVVVNKGSCGPDTSACYNLNCVSYYTTTYDSTLNNFTLVVDPVSSAIATGYRWDFGDGTTSTLPIPPAHTYTIDTLYNLCMKIYTASGDSCQYCHIIGKDSLGNIVRSTPGFTLNVENDLILYIPDNITETTLSIIPNPFSNSTFIQFNHPLKSASLNLFNVTGEKVKTINFSGDSIKIERENLSEGIYLYQIIKDDGNILNGKLMVVD